MQIYSVPYEHPPDEGTDSLVTSLRESLDGLPPIGKSKMGEESPPMKAMAGIGNLSIKQLQDKM